MVRLFQILAAGLALAAAFFLWRENADCAFASAVLAACSFFLSIRFTFKARVEERRIAKTSDVNEE